MKKQFLGIYKGETIYAYFDTYEEYNNCMDLITDLNTALGNQSIKDTKRELESFKKEESLLTIFIARCKRWFKKTF